MTQNQNPKQFRKFDIGYSNFLIIDACLLVINC